MEREVRFPDRIIQQLPQFTGHSIQVRVRHGDKKGREGRPITLREMGDTVFDVLKKLMVSLVTLVGCDGEN